MKQFPFSKKGGSDKFKNTGSNCKQHLSPALDQTKGLINSRLLTYQSAVNATSISQQQQIYHPLLQMSSFWPSQVSLCPLTRVKRHRHVLIVQVRISTNIRETRIGICWSCRDIFSDTEIHCIHSSRSSSFSCLTIEI